MYVVNYKEREKKDVEMAGSQKTTVRWLVGKQTGAKSYAMRRFEIAPGGIIPLHSHAEEHEIFVLNGEATILGNLEGTAKKDDIVFVPSKEPHGYDNREGSKPFIFICCIPLLNEE